jgi:hypothetical protein
LVERALLARGIAQGKVAPSHVIARSRFNPNLDYTFFILPSLAIAKGVMLKDLSLSVVAQSILPLVAITAVTLGAAVVMFRRRVA